MADPRQGLLDLLGLQRDQDSGSYLTPIVGEASRRLGNFGERVGDAFTMQMRPGEVADQSRAPGGVNYVAPAAVSATPIDTAQPVVAPQGTPPAIRVSSATTPELPRHAGVGLSPEIVAANAGFTPADIAAERGRIAARFSQSSPIATPSQNPLGQTMQLGTVPTGSAFAPAQGPQGTNLGVLDQVLQRVGPRPVYMAPPRSPSNSEVLNGGREVLPGQLAAGFPATMTNEYMNHLRQQGVSFDIPAFTQNMHGYGTAATAATNALGDIMRNRLGEGQLGLESSRAFGIPAQDGQPAAQGSIANAAQQAGSQHSPSGMYRMAESNIINQGIQNGTITPDEGSARLRTLFNQGQPLPDVNVAGGNPDFAARISSARSAAMGAYPMQGNRRTPSAGGAAREQENNNAITNYLGTFQPDELRANYNTIMAGLTNSPNLNSQAIRNWYRASIGGSIGSTPQTEEHVRLRNILARLHGQALQRSGILGNTTWGLAGDQAPTQNLPMSLIGSR